MNENTDASRKRGILTSSLRPEPSKSSDQNRAHRTQTQAIIQVYSTKNSDSEPHGKKAVRKFIRESIKKNTAQSDKPAKSETLWHRFSCTHALLPSLELFTTVDSFVTDRSIPKKFQTRTVAYPKRRDKQGCDISMRFESP
jgi:hypothetical protein